MRSSISSSDPWRGFFRLLLASAGGLAVLLYLFVVTIDPWDILPASPPLPRVPITGNARFSFPALAASDKFDSAIIGTSTSRLLRPAALDARLGTRFVNLAMNSATPFEQASLLKVFLRHHPAARVVLIGLDGGWCSPAPYRTTPRPFPDWMYGGSPWRGYREMFNLFALQEAAKQFAVMIGLKRPPYGLDGYTSFLPGEDRYDPARARMHLADDLAPADPVDPRRPPPAFPAFAMLADALAQAPPATQVLLAFAPYYIGLQGAPGTQAASDLAACKRGIAAIATDRPHTALIDFMIPSPITTIAENYWDPRHYRLAIAERLVGDIAAVATGQAPLPGDAEIVTARQ